MIADDMIGELLQQAPTKSESGKQSGTQRVTHKTHEELKNMQTEISNLMNEKKQMQD